MSKIDFDIDGISNVQFKVKENKVALTFNTLDKAIAAAEPGDEIVILANGVEQMRLKVVKGKQLPKEHPVGKCYIPEELLEGDDEQG